MPRHESLPFQLSSLPRFTQSLNAFGILFLGFADGIMKAAEKTVGLLHDLHFNGASRLMHANVNALMKPAREKCHSEKTLVRPARVHCQEDL